ncbi:N-(5'-phosphoribosyl)anthranilate isomerase [Bacillus sp. THAF10]|uniref:phosphoribosylanthranilate isomerase n=1 Tax=Bacillus sp. THAF10 TaxID=2587848 RepID=UPI0012680470|nr:phosphoribosylanthranilate isomerase [Bacillus sp. THAF10]QFT89396.1 N-(5'-phosphoribosyl)anthranilate isomerase [Bacillus sp. THAF10]
MSNTLLKYCGIKSRDDYFKARQSKANYLGFIFADSKRQVQSKQVASWLKENPPGDKKLVGVFVNQAITEIVQITKEVHLDVIQCHGEEEPSFIKELKESTNAEIWKVIHHKSQEQFNLAPYKDLIQGIVVDSKKGSQYGGTGTRFDWEAIPHYQRQAKEISIPCFIAGGVNGETIEELLSYQPEGIDISSGIETDFSKDVAKMNFIESKVKHDETSTESR